ncbi:MAG: hypothetical protein ABIH79_01235 [archaeon]
MHAFIKLSLRIDFYSSPALRDVALWLVLRFASDTLTAIKTPLRCTSLRPSVLWVASKPTGK